MATITPVTANHWLEFFSRFLKSFLVAGCLISSSSLFHLSIVLPEKENFCWSARIHLHYPVPVLRLLASLSIKKGGAVPYRYLVTILRLASMQYITKLVILQSQKPRFPLLQITKYGNVLSRRQCADS
jgi:hypothetical protein